MFIFDAVYVNSGGGAVLLRYLISMLAHRTDIEFWLDERLELDCVPARYRQVAPGEFSRLLLYARLGRGVKKVFCFGNVPPPVRLSCHVCTYFHGLLLLSQDVVAVGAVARQKNKLKRFYISLVSRNADNFFVQTEVGALLLKERLGVSLDDISLVPFWNGGRYALHGALHDRNSFGYVSLPSSYKGHAELLDAWEILASRGLFPELHLTLPLEINNALFSRVETLCSRGIRIINHGFCDPARIYAHCGWQIYPSRLESFGLGLIEAVEAGCRILAPDLPYVHAVVSPSLTWRAEGGAHSIADAVVLSITESHGPSVCRTANKIGVLLDFFSPR